MSRVYDALQKSQGESPNASPLAPSQTEAVASEASGDAGIPGAGAVSSPAGIPEMATPQMPVARTDAKWLSVPPERVLHPQPTPEQRLVSIADPDRKSTRLNSSHRCISYAVFCL